MKAITLWQPWASLIAVGAKTIETRGWATNYRGPLAIHAAKRRAKFEDMKHLVSGQLDAWEAWFRAGLVSDDGATDNMPYGQIVATCTLSAVVPISVASWDDFIALALNAGGEGIVCMDSKPLVTSVPISSWSVGVAENAEQPGGLKLLNRKTGYMVEVEDQRPYGDFTPGRFAWLLTDVVSCAIPAKGHQGLWEVEL